MTRGWYIELWDICGKAAKEHRTLTDFALVVEFIERFRAQLSTDILRVLAPWNATYEQIQELKSNGATFV
jgi:hypothetical protein